MTIEQRVERLDRQNRWMRRVGGLMLAAVACVVLMGQGKAKALPDLECGSLVMKDRGGRVRLRAGFEEDGSVFFALQGHGGRNLRLGVDARGSPTVTLNDVSRRKLSATLSGSGLAIRDGGGKYRLTIAAVHKGPTSVSVHDQSGTVRAALSVKPSGLPGVDFRNAKDKLRLRLGVAADGVPALDFRNRHGQPHGNLALRATEKAVALAIRDMGGNVIWQAPSK